MAKEPDILTKVLSDVAEDLTEHRDSVTIYDRRYKAYRGLVEARSEAAEWTPKFHPAYIWQAIETMSANLLDANPHWNLRVHPQMADPGRMQDLRDGARANELLLRHQLSLDKWAEKQRAFDLQGLICGITAAQQSWLYREGQLRSNSYYDEDVLDGYGQSIGSVKRREVLESTDVLRDDPTSEVVDVRHLILQRGATSLASSERLTRRCYYSFEQMKRMECKNGSVGHEGECEPGRYFHDVDKLQAKEGGGSPPPDRHQREAEIHGTRPHRDDYEILHQYRREGNTLRCIAVSESPKVLLENRISPYWFDHLDHPFPFVICSGAPDLFRIPGISETEMMAELQEMLWTIGGQRIANLELVNNAIVMLADDLEDQDLTFAPGEQWLLPRPVEESVKLWTPDVTAAQVSLQAEALIKGDLQNVTGGMPFLSGTSQEGVDQETATGVSIVTSLAQKRLNAKKQQFVWAKGRIGEQWCALNQQYITEPRLIPVVGKDGAEAFEEYRPEAAKGLFLFETEIVDESMDRSTRRAEAQAKLNIAISAFQPMMMSAPLNLKAFMDDVLDSYDITDKERYYTAQPQLPAAMQGGAPGATAVPAPTNGVTNPELAAGQAAPSNENSMSGVAAIQQMLAQKGGANNGPT